MQVEKASEIWAHRGASAEFPENTMAAFERAVDLGADGIEIDVQRSADGELFVMHDEYLERLTEHKAYLYELSAEQIKGLEIVGPLAKGSHKIPTLRELLAFLQDKTIKLNIELKNSIYFYPGMEEEIVELVENFAMQEQVYYSSFNHESIARLAKLVPQDKLGILYYSILYDDVAYAKSLGAKNLHPLLNSLRKSDFVQNAHNAGLKIHAWTANEDQHIKSCLSLGVDAIITDEVAKALAMREAFCQGKE